MEPSKLLRINAVFLAFMGSAAATADAVGHFLGKGPFGEVMFQATLTIGSFEAHLLAVVLGVLLWRGAADPDRRQFHVLAAAIHTILGGSNVLFFEDAFGALGIRTFGVVVTTLHAAFVLAQLGAAARLSRAGGHGAVPSKG